MLLLVFTNAAVKTGSEDDCLVCALHFPIGKYLWLSEVATLDILARYGPSQLTQSNFRSGVCSHPALPLQHANEPAAWPDRLSCH